MEFIAKQALIAAANTIALAIDHPDTTSYPEELIAQWQLIVEALRRLGMTEEEQAGIVICPGQW